MGTLAKTAVVTGSASGIGQATARLLRDQGCHVIGVDLHDAEVIADLATEAGRTRMVEAVQGLAPDGLDLVVAAAGISHGQEGRVLAVNYFGVVATLEGLRPLLAQRPAAQAIALVSTAAIDPVDQGLVDACLAGDEGSALTLAASRRSPAEYASSKRALGLWLRRTAVRPEWAGSGLHLNGIAPGLTLTGMTRPLMADPEIRKQVELSTPRVVPHAAEAETQAEAVLALAGLAGNYLIGQVLFIDGGTEALRRPDLV